MSVEKGPQGPRSYDYGPFDSEMPTGSRFLSPAFETAQRTLMGSSPYQSLPYWNQAITELRNLPGGEDAHNRVLEAFRRENKREPGDAYAHMIEMGAKFPDMETWRYSYDQYADLYVADIREMAYRLSREFDGENNPRTPEFVQRISKEYVQLSEKAQASFSSGRYKKVLPQELYLGIGPSSVDQEKQEEAYIEEFGKPWNEMEEDDFYENPYAATYALRNFPGYELARDTARWEWDELKPILSQVRGWHNFYSDEEEYVVRRTNTLLGDPLHLKAYSHASKALDRLTPSTVLGMNCEAILDFADLYGLPKDNVWQVFRDALEYYCDDEKKSALNKMEAMKLNFYADPERFVRAYNKQVKYGLRLWK